MAIRINGSASPVETISIGDTVTLTNSDDTGVVSWAWVIESKPNGSSATLSSATASNPTFTADKEGAYRVSLATNGGSKTYAVGRVLTTHVGLQPLAKDETNEADSTEGWAKPWRESYQKIDQRIGLADRRTVKYIDPTTITGPRMLYVVGTASLPNGDVVPTVQLFNGAPGPRAVFMFDSTGSLTQNDIIKPLARGLSNPIPNPRAFNTGSAALTQYGSVFAAGSPPTWSSGSFQYLPPTSSSYIENKFYLGFCAQSASDGSGNVRIWLDPASPPTTAATFKEVIDLQGSTSFYWESNFNSVLSASKKIIIQTPDLGPLLQLYADSAATSGSSIAAYNGGVILGGEVVSVLGILEVDARVVTDEIRAQNTGSVTITGRSPDVSGSFGVVIDTDPSLTTDFNDRNIIGFKQGGTLKARVDAAGNFYGNHFQTQGVYFGNSPLQTTPYIVRLGKSTRTSVQTISQGAGDVQIDFDTVNYNVNNFTDGFTASAAQFDVLFSGYYEIIAVLSVTANTTTTSVTVKAQVEGVDGSSTTAVVGTTTQTITLHTIELTSFYQDTLRIVLSTDNDDVEVTGYMIVRHLGSA